VEVHCAFRIFEEGIASQGATGKAIDRRRSFDKLVRDKS